MSYEAKYLNGYHAITRRDFLAGITGFLASAILPVHLAAPFGENRPANEARILEYQREDEIDYRGLERMYVYSEAQIQPSDSEITVLKARIQEHFGGAIRHEEGIILDDWHVSRWFTPEPSARFAAKIRDKSLDAILHARHLLQSNNINRSDFKFYIPKNEGDFYSIEETTSRMPIILCFNYGTEYGVRATYTDSNGVRKTIRVVHALQDSWSSEWLNRGLSPAQHRSKDPISQSPLNRRAIFIPLQLSALELVLHPTCELLHSDLYEYTGMHLNREWNTILDRNPEFEHDDIMSRVIKEDIGRKWRNREELAVHSAALMWMRTYNEERFLGLMEIEFEAAANNLTDYENDPGDAGNILAISGRLGMASTIENYKLNPKLLFG